MTTQQQHLSPGGILATEEPTKRDRFANGHLIWQTILELRNTERRINRRALADLTGLKPGVVDDHVERWIEKDQLRRAGNGELEVVEHFPATRPISTTDLPDGMVKLEVGSDYLELTPLRSPHDRAQVLRAFARACAGRKLEQGCGAVPRTRPRAERGAPGNQGAAQQLDGDGRGGQAAGTVDLTTN